MREYKTINPHEMKKSTRVTGLIASFGLIWLGIKIVSIYTALVGIVIFLSVIYRKEMLFNEEGYLTKFDFIFFKHEDIWRYDQISNMHREKAPDINYMGIIIQKDMALKRAVVLKKDVEDILELASSKNSKIYIGDIDD
ncbi:MAG: hypothetical protein IKU53_01705 [Firmicutes bacterium]|nr:hypothetical protein [Bacillota bacterium]